jgi:hypothetical protein
MAVASAMVQHSLHTTVAQAVLAAEQVFLVQEVLLP